MTSAAPTLACSFCDAPRQDVSWLVTGHSACICDACFDVSVERLRRARAAQTSPALVEPATSPAVVGRLVSTGAA